MTKWLAYGSGAEQSSLYENLQNSGFFLCTVLKDQPYSEVLYGKKRDSRFEENF